MFCPKCGNELPDTATFCNKCGNRLAARTASPSAQKKSVMPQKAVPASTASTAPNVGSGLSVMSIVRIALGVIAIVLVFLPWISVDYAGAVSGQSSMTMNMPDLVSGKFMASWVLVVYIVGASVLIIGSLVELISRIELLKWVSLFGAAVVVIVSVAFALNGDASASESIGIASLQYGPTIVPWVAAILGLVGAVTCFVKR